VFGPAPAPISRVRGKHRVRILIKVAKGTALQSALRDWRDTAKIPNSVRMNIDIDPQSFY